MPYQGTFEVTADSQTLRERNNTRRRLLLQNPQSNSNSIWLRFQNADGTIDDATTDTECLEVLPGGSFSVAKLSEKMYFGPINVISDAASVDIYLFEE